VSATRRGTHPSVSYQPEYNTRWLSHRRLLSPVSGDTHKPLASDDLDALLLLFLLVIIVCKVRDEPRTLTLRGLLDTWRQEGAA